MRNGTNNADAMLISIDKIQFRSPKGFPKRRYYAVGIAADNVGQVIVSEPPGSALIRHRPGKESPGIWDFPLDGLSVYHRTGGLPDIVVGHLLIIRDRSRVRAKGETIHDIKNSSTSKDVIGKAAKLLKNGNPALGLVGSVGPVLGLVGELLAKKNDQVIDTFTWSLRVTAERVERGELTEVVMAPSGDLQVEIDVFFFDARAEDPSVAETSGIELRLSGDGKFIISERDG